MSVRGDYAKLERLIAGTGDMARSYRRQVLEAFALDLQYRTDKCFKTGTSPYGEKWKALSHPSKRRRGGVPLSDTGRLKNSIAGQVPRVTTQGLSISSNVVYAGVHNFGGTVRHGRRTNLHNPTTGRFLKKTLKSTSQGSNQRTVTHFSREGTKETNQHVRVSFTPAHDAKVPQRQFLPDEARGLPAEYAQDLTKTAKAVLDVLLKGAT